ncbi:SMC-Scp complex subunit ScpB [Arsenicicoccus dermatophilus]|uniref:SMC-Scp complex subunit ScpB n=1 Tax=Arsenicicoccus dermatophilus TaxID=1076331 RepID=UPI001F4CE3D8|nr:SMC-Scp complex subunit ScpB [Arsenicicoccus dermatophilus]
MTDAQVDIEASDPASRPPEEDAVDVRALPGGLRAALEAVLMVVEEPIDEPTLAAALEVSLDEVHLTLRGLAREYDEQGRGFQLRALAGGWRYYSRAEHAPAVERFLLDGQRARLTQASLETLAVIAYRQPVSRARVSAVRGVSVDGVIRTLMTRGLITEIGHDETTGAVLYGTTPYFLQRMGLTSLDELPALAPYLPDTDILDEIAEQGR